MKWPLIICLVGGLTQMTAAAPAADTAARVQEPVQVQIQEETVRMSKSGRMIPMDSGLCEVLRESCAGHGVPVELALGVIETESAFDVNADSGVCRGLMQLHRKYYPGDLTPEENLQLGIGTLGRLKERYGDWGAALTAYNAGRDTGSRTYAQCVFRKAAAWGWEG